MTCLTAHKPKRLRERQTNKINIKKIPKDAKASVQDLGGYTLRVRFRALNRIKSVKPLKDCMYSFRGSEATVEY